MSRSAEQTRTPLGFDVWRVGELAWIVCPYCNVRLLVDVCSPARSLCVESMLDEMLGEHVNSWCTDELINSHTERGSSWPSESHAY